ncbi:unnamed protein product [Lactuca saligna]|uniref:Reverse transcriptase zinc-binding domain-containing protein n=1 Tax=Lactuca saligna TaxID=75948 RepID=A0AA35YDG2_LACSI|nr:unnamed protein product [Lactuca saligna]
MLHKQSGPGGETWRCNLTVDGSFTVNVLRKKLDLNSTLNLDQFTWLREIPIKINCFIWRAKMGKIPSTLGLLSRGVDVEKKLCSHCEVVECVDHALVGCKYASTVLQLVLKWCRVPLVELKTVHEVITYAQALSNCSKKKKVANGNL